MYHADDPQLAKMDRDVEAVYEAADTGYVLLQKNE